MGLMLDALKKGSSWGSRAHVPEALSGPPARAAKSGWGMLFTPGGLAAMVTASTVVAIWSGWAKVWTLQLITRLLEYLPTLAIAVALVLGTAILIAVALWSLFHRRELGEHGKGMALKGVIGAAAAVAFIPLFAFGVSKAQTSSAALTESYLGKAPAASLCQSTGTPTQPIVGPTPHP